MPAQAQEAFLAALRHGHDHGQSIAGHETRTRWVVALTFAMMVGELVVGYATHSLALTADGWHMATHAGALAMAAFAYSFARRHAESGVFSFGTGKVHALAGYTSAVILAMVALWMVAESVRRLWHPEVIAFADALPIAVLGLVVNLVSAKLLHADPLAGERDDDTHHHHHGEHTHHGHDDHPHGAPAHDHHDHDHNLRAAYLHVLADALTSVLAILALLGGRFFGWGFLDAAMGIIGGGVIARWSYGLCRGAARQLLDAVPVRHLEERLRSHIEAVFANTSVVDAHVWELGAGARACILSVATTAPQPATAYRAALGSLGKFDHVTVEVHALAAGTGSAVTP